MAVTRSPVSRQASRGAAAGGQRGPWVTPAELLLEDASQDGRMTEFARAAGDREDRECLGVGPGQRRQGRSCDPRPQRTAAR